MKGIPQKRGLFVKRLYSGLLAAALAVSLVRRSRGGMAATAKKETPDVGASKWVYAVSQRFGTVAPMGQKCAGWG